MKYYILKQEGIANILGIDSEMVHCYNYLFRDDELYLREDEEIKLSEMITSHRVDTKYSVEKIDVDGIIINAYMEVDIGEMDYFRIASEDLNFDKTSTVEEIYNIISERLSNKSFSFNRMMDELYSYQYKEVTEEEYKEHKLLTTFSFLTNIS